jgi:hypothetical protein
LARAPKLEIRPTAATVTGMAGVERGRDASRGGTLDIVPNLNTIRELAAQKQAGTFLESPIAIDICS